MKRCTQNAGIPSSCRQSNLLSVVINEEPPDGTDKMLFHHQGYHLISDNVRRERLYPTVKTGGLQLLAGEMIVTAEELLICQINVTSLNKVFIKGLKSGPQC